MTDPNYDVCTYCEADGCETGTAIHADDCPSETGVFPVTVRDLGGRCDHCGEPRMSMGCCRCDHQFEVGETYHHIRIEDTDDDLPGYEVVCASCAVHAAIAAPS